MNRIVVNVVLFVLLLLGCSWVTVAMFGDRIQNSLADEAKRALEAIDGFPMAKAEVRFSGRRAIVTGEVHDASLIGEAGNGIARVHGVRSVENSLAYRHMEHAWLSLAVKKKTRVLEVSGLLPEGDWRVEVLKALRGIDSGGTEGGETDEADAWRVTDSIEEKRDVFDPGWVSGVGELLPAFLRYKRAERLAVSDGKVTLEGELFFDADWDSLTRAANAAFAEIELEIDNRFEVVPPPVAPDFRLIWDANGGVKLSGTVIEAEVKQRMETAIAGLLAPQRKAAGGIEVGENIDDANWEQALMRVLAGYLNAAKEGSLAVQGSEISAGALVTSNEMKDSLLQLLEQEFPKEHYAINAALKVAEPPRPAMMSIIKLPGESVRLKGTLPSGAMKKQFMESVRARLPEGMEIGDQIEVRRNTTTPDWLGALVEMMPLYIANTRRGGLTVHGASLAIEAQVATETNWDTVWALIEQHFPETRFRRLLDLKIVPGDGVAGDEVTPVDPEAPIGSQ